MSKKLALDILMRIKTRIPMARPKTGRTREAANISLPKGIKRKGKRLAKIEINNSLSELVSRMLLRRIRSYERRYGLL